MYKEGSAMLEIQKRPFVRPLIFWIAGILLQICFPLQTVSFAVLFIALIILLLSFALTDKNDVAALYPNRWVWGAVFACIVVFLAIQTTALTELRLNNPQEPGFLLRKALEMQSRMVAKLDLLRLPDEDKTILATLTVNYRQALSWELRNQFSVTGVVHILSVSGFHVGIVCAFVNLLLSVFPQKAAIARWMKYLATMSSVWAFAFISGLGTAAVRAAVMLTIYFTGRAVLRRNADRYNTLAGAAF